MKELEKRVFELCSPIVIKNNATLEEVHFEKEQGMQFLRLFIDAEGGVNINMCTAISEEVALIEEIDNAIDGEYYLEVSSMGIERELKSDSDILKHVNDYVHVSLYKKVDNFKEGDGYLRSFENEMLTIEVNIKGRIKNVTFNKKDMALIRLAIKF